MIGRFAPSPTGRLHLGNIWAALLNYLFVRSAGGRLIMRLEDIDLPRCREEYITCLLDDMALLGLDYDEGFPAEGSSGSFRQSGRQEIYQQVLDSFRQKDLCYPCYCSRAELHESSAPHAVDGRMIYNGACRSLKEHPAGKKPAWRLLVPDRQIGFTDCLQGSYTLNLASEWGDFIIKRSDGLFAYQLACAVDDGMMGVDFVLRGYDLLASSCVQIYILELLGYPPPSYCHVPLLVDGEGSRLSKRQYSMDLGQMLQNGASPEGIIGSLAALAGIIPKPEEVKAQELIAIFKPELLPKTSNIIIDGDFITQLYKI